MCGICGIVSLDQQAVQEKHIRKMMRIQKHRGPDDEGIFLEKNIGFGFVRLSILDLSPAANQPMFSSDNRFVIVYNGEIYNYLELREELESFGHCFRTRTDTEVLLAAYMQWGKDCLEKCNGMWAFALYDRKHKTLFASRDRFGVKPFYYLLNNRFFAFASEIPPLLSLLPQKPSPDLQSIFDYLVFNRTDHSQSTFFQQIKKLQHGHCFTLDIQGFQSSLLPSSGLPITRWYNLKSRIEHPDSTFTPSDLRQLFSSSIALRLRSDVPIGVCLSGGLDSSSIVSTLRNDFGHDNLNTFSAIYHPDQRGDESAFIDLYRPYLKNMHFTRPSAYTLMEDLHRFVRAHSEPVPSTNPYAQFKVMELAKLHVVVTLDGQGADETLAGYHYFFGFFFKELLKNRDFSTLLSEFIHYGQTHRSFYGYLCFIYFLLPAVLRTSLSITKNPDISKDFLMEYQKTTEVSSRLYGSKDLRHALFNHFEYKLEHLLKWEDRNSMFFSIEARLPFLDYRLVEKLLSTKSSQIIRKGMTKYILRQSMKGVLPEPIRTRIDKIGFDTPQDTWFRTEVFRDYIYDLIMSESFRSRNFWNLPLVLRMYKDHMSGEKNHGQTIWKWIHLENWFRMFIDPLPGEVQYP